MTAPVLADTLGPRGRRQVRVVSFVAGAVIAALLLIAFRRLHATGQLDADMWRPFTRWLAIKFLLVGLRNTVTTAALAMALALTIGAFMALARLARTRVLRWIAGVYVEFFRSVPLYLLIVYCAFGLPRSGIDVTLFQGLVLGLTLYNSAILAEVFRAGIRSLDRGQGEAASALGMGYWQSMLLVVIPQAVRRMVPAIVSQLVTLLKDTSLGVVISYEEFLRRAQISGEYFRNPLPSYVVAAMVFIAVNYTLSRVARYLEIRQRHRYGADAMHVSGLDDLAVVGAQAQAAMPDTSGVGAGVA
jgi:glutamate transport system permease protein